MKSPSLLVLGLLSALCSAEIVVQTKPGGTVALKCSLSDSNSVLKWLRGSELIYSVNPRTGMPLKGKGEIAKRSRLKNERHLEISQVSAADAGLFTCRVNNQEDHHRLVVSSVSVAPSGPLDVGSRVVLGCDVAGLEQGSAVQWRGPGGRSEQKTTVVLEPVLVSDSGPWECVFTSGGETVSQTLVLQVREPRPKTTPAPSTTRVTEDVPFCSDCVVSTLGSPLSPGGLGGWWVWAAVAGASLVLLLWLLILVLYSQRRRRRRQFMKMRKTMQLRPKQYCHCPCPTAVMRHGTTKPSFPAP